MAMWLNSIWPNIIQLNPGDFVTDTLASSLLPLTPLISHFKVWGTDLILSNKGSVNLLGCPICMSICKSACACVSCFACTPVSVCVFHEIWLKFLAWCLVLKYSILASSLSLSWQWYPSLSYFMGLGKPGNLPEGEKASVRSIFFPDS